MCGWVGRILCAIVVSTAIKYAAQYAHNCTVACLVLSQDFMHHWLFVQWTIHTIHRPFVSNIITAIKAFDSVPHKRLLAKLEYYGISGNTLKWFKAFLTCRKQRVVLNNSQSSWRPVVSGVPQGTVLGLLFFLLYINDIDCDIKSTARLFADDCILYREINSASDAQIFQDDINKFQAWASVWQMKFNSSKCHILSITRKRNNSTQPEITDAGVWHLYVRIIINKTIL